MSSIREVLEAADTAIKDEVRKELRTQGHYLTGKLEGSIKGTIKITAKDATLTGTAMYYGQILNAGTTPERIPFGLGSGAKHSKYIDALINYFKLRGLDDKEAKGAAFATAMKQKKEGMPTSTSSKYSSTGNRLNFIGVVRTAIDTTLDKTILSGIDKVVDEIYKESPSERI